MKPFVFACRSVALTLVFTVRLALGAAGDLDPSFGAGGKVTTDFGGGSSEFARAMAVQSDGKILVAGTSENGGQESIFLVRYAADGTLDSDFGSGGKVATVLGDGTHEATGVAIQADGKIVVVGTFASNGFNTDVVLVRYHANGSLDTDFDSDGIVMTHIGAFARADAVVVQDDGKIVVAGSSTSSGELQLDVLVVRYETDGTLDLSFNGTGTVKTRVGVRNALARSVLVQGDGKIVVAGQAVDQRTAVPKDWQVLVARYTSGGKLDKTFNRTGVVTTTIAPGETSGTNFARMTAAALQADGKILVAGYREGAPNDDFALVRYTTAGALDLSFNSTGRVVTNFDGDQAEGDDLGFAVAVQKDGKVLVAGQAFVGGVTTDMAIARYTSLGTLDTSFRGTGKLTIPIGTNADFARAMVVQADGGILLAGGSFRGSEDRDIAVVRLLGDTSLDVTSAPPTGITASGAMLHGSMNPHGEAGATAFFEYGTSPSALTNQTPPVAVGNGSDPVPVTAALTGLAKGTVYYYRLVATLGGDFSPQRGETLNFATISLNPPGVISQPASGLTVDAATLNATVNPNSLATSARFEWGATTTYGNMTVDVDLGSGAAPVPLSANLTGLMTDQTYHFRAVAVSEAGATFGPDRTFTPSAGAPQPQDDVVLIDGVATVRVLDNDTDLNGDALTLVGLDPDVAPAAGTAQTLGSLLFYTPGDGMLEDEFGYIVQDATGKQAKARVRAYRLSEIRGAYFGVLGRDAGTGQLNMDIGPSGAFSLLLTWQGFDYAIKGRLDSDRSFVTPLARQGVEANALLLLELRFDPLSGQIVAQLTDSVLGGPFVFDVPRAGDADAALDAVSGQLYTTTIDVPEIVPAQPESGVAALNPFADKFRGSGFAAVKIAKNGSARFVGQMPDTEKFSAGSRASRRTFAFYSALYRIKNGALGSVSGNTTLQSDFQLRGDSLRWQRQADQRDAIFNGSFNTPAFLNGDRYTPPARGQLMQIGLELLSGAFSNANLSMTLGGLNPELTQKLKFVPGSVRVVGENPSNVKVRISPATGAFSGSFTHNASQEATKFRGVFITSPFQIREGRGSFRGMGAGGKVRIAKP